jgi:hypothetical protein
VHGLGLRLMIAVMDPRQPDDRQRGEWEAEFEAAARRPLKTRLRYAFIHTYKPVLDDAKYRSFDTMAQYRAWCVRELPEWLGYGAAV